MARFVIPQEIKTKSNIKRLMEFGKIINQDRRDALPSGDLSIIWEALADGRISVDEAVGLFDGTIPMDPALMGRDIIGGTNKGLEKKASQLIRQAEKAGMVEKTREQGVRSLGAQNATEAAGAGTAAQEGFDPVSTNAVSSELTPELRAALMQSPEGKALVEAADAASREVDDEIRGRLASNAAASNASPDAPPTAAPPAAAPVVEAPPVAPVVEVAGMTAAQQAAKEEHFQILKKVLREKIGPDADRLQSFEELRAAVDTAASRPEVPASAKPALKSARDALDAWLTNPSRYDKADWKGIAGVPLRDIGPKSNAAGELKDSLRTLFSERQVEAPAVAATTTGSQPQPKGKAPQGQPGVVGNVKPSEQFKIPTNLEEALAAEELESETWRQRTRNQGTLHTNAKGKPTGRTMYEGATPPNVAGQTEDVRGLGRGARRPLQFPLAKAGAVEAAAVTPKAPPPPTPTPPVPKTALGSLMDMVKGLVSGELGAVKEVGETFSKKGMIAGTGALGKWGLMTGAGGLLTSMLMSGATNQFNEIRRIQAAEVPSVENILNRARLQEMQVEQARNTLNSNPELMNKLLRQVSEQQISRKGMLPGEIQIGGTLGEGPFSDPEGLVTRLAIGLPPG